jgi:CheY-like chemotaxis protein
MPSEIKILIVEDVHDIRANLSEMLSSAEYTVLEAASAREGLAIACEQIPDLIISDIMMPEHDGFWLKDQINNHSIQTRNIPFIFLSAKAGKNDIREGMTEADDYLTKPFRVHELIVAVESRLQRKRNFAEENYDTLMQIVQILSATLDNGISRTDKLLELAETVKPLVGQEQCSQIENLQRQIFVDRSTMHKYRDWLIQKTESLKS